MKWNSNVKEYYLSYQITLSTNGETVITVYNSTV